MKPTTQPMRSAGLDKPGRDAHLTAIPSGPRARTLPTETAYAEAAQRIQAQLDPHEATARQTIAQVVRQVGLTIATWAVALAHQAQQRQRGEHRLTRLEQWVVMCRQLERQQGEAAQPAESGP